MDLVNLNTYSKKKYSQTGEEGILEHIFNQIGTTNKVAVEFGALDGSSLSNTRYFVDLGWKAIMFDGKTPPASGVHCEFLTVENINAVFCKYGVPTEFDLLSIDVDGNDYWLWNALRYRPRVVIIEMNGTIHVGLNRTIPYNPTFACDGTDYYGASFGALKKLGESKDYTLIHQCHALNMFFVRSDIIPNMSFNITYTHNQYHPHDTQNRPWVEV